MTESSTGPFNGLFKNLENIRLAEIWINEIGADYEFNRDEFVGGTGINPNSSSRVLNMLTEKGIITCYPSRKDSRKLLYRVAWPVTVVKPAAPELVVVSAEVVKVAGPRYTFVVSMTLGEESFTDMEIDASSPEEAAQLARESIRIRVSQEWEF